VTRWIVDYGTPFPGYRIFTDHAQAIEFATTAVADEQPTITQLDSTEEQA
jgi:hypothetical protein